ncbi:MAG: hypothetical protein KF778_10025 [Rhodocyclaceae bacterium]|nr:hypothetical protein [Rhodocyclaceae bacterium]
MNFIDRRLQRLLALTLVGVCAGAGPALAVELFDGAVQVHGFASQAAIRSNGNNNFLGPSSQQTSFRFTELGLNVAARLDERLNVAAQVMSRSAGADAHGALRVDFALADLTLQDTETLRLGLRGGRVKIPYGFYNSTRDIAFTRPGVVLPQSIYPERVRAFSDSLDGVAPYGRFSAGNVELLFEAALGKPRLDDKETTATFLGSSVRGLFEGDRAAIGRVMLQDARSKWRLAYSQAHLNGDYRRAGSDPLAAGQVKLELSLFSAELNLEPWSFTAEHVFGYASTKNFGISRPDVSVPFEGAYLQGAWRAGTRWQWFLRYDTYYQDRYDRDGSRLATATRLPSYIAYAHDRTLGVRFDVSPAFMLRAEFHKVTGTGWLPVLDNSSAGSVPQREWDMLMLLGSLRF